MLKDRPDILRACGTSALLIGLLVLALLAPAPLRAGKKKASAPSARNSGEQRTTEYFDLNKIVWPNPPAIVRIKFLDLFTGEKIDASQFAAKKKKEGWMERLAGSKNTNEIKITSLPFQLIRAYGVAVDSKGRIYAADQGVGAVFIFNPEDKAHVELIGNGKQVHFGMIVGLALDDNDTLFVSDAKLHHVAVINTKHEEVAALGADVLVRPGGMALDRNNRLLYVADTGNDVVDVFDADSYKLLRQIGKPSRKHDQTDLGTFSLPEDVAVDKDGNFYVTDTFNDRVEIFDADGEFMSAFGKNGDGPADFQRPKGIAVDCDGHIWVVDAVQNRVKVYNNQGRLLIYFGAQGYFPGQFMGPWGITIDKLNRVIVSETFPGRVQMFRYVTDSEAAAEEALGEGKGKPASTVAPERKSAAQAGAETPGIAVKDGSGAH